MVLTRGKKQTTIDVASSSDEEIPRKRSTSSQRQQKEKQQDSSDDESFIKKNAIPLRAGRTTVPKKKPDVFTLDSEDEGELKTTPNKKRLSKRIMDDEAEEGDEDDAKSKKKEQQNSQIISDDDDDDFPSIDIAKKSTTPSKKQTPNRGGRLKKKRISNDSDDENDGDGDAMDDEDEDSEEVSSSLKSKAQEREDMARKLKAAAESKAKQSRIAAFEKAKASPYDPKAKRRGRLDDEDEEEEEVYNVEVVSDDDEDEMDEDNQNEEGEEDEEEGAGLTQKQKDRRKRRAAEAAELRSARELMPAAFKVVDEDASFNIYLQYMLTVSLDPYFTYDPHDDYFSTAVTNIQKALRSRQSSTVESNAWDIAIKRVIIRRPYLDYVDHASVASKTCDVCKRTNHPTRCTITIGGAPYKSDKFWEGEMDPENDPSQQPFSTVQTVKFKSGTTCKARVILYHAAQHFQFHLLIKCREHVQSICAQLRVKNEEQNHEAILHACLEDARWVKKIKHSYDELIHALEHAQDASKTRHGLEEMDFDGLVSIIYSRMPNQQTIEQSYAKRKQMEKERLREEEEDQENVEEQGQEEEQLEEQDDESDEVDDTRKRRDELDTYDPDLEVYLGPEEQPQSIGRIVSIDDEEDEFGHREFKESEVLEVGLTQKESEFIEQDVPGDEDNSWRDKMFKPRNSGKYMPLQEEEEEVPEDEQEEEIPIRRSQRNKRKIPEEPEPEAEEAEEEEEYVPSTRSASQRKSSQTPKKRARKARELDEEEVEEQPAAPQHDMSFIDSEDEEVQEIPAPPSSAKKSTPPARQQQLPQEEEGSDDESMSAISQRRRQRQSRKEGDQSVMEAYFSPNSSQSQLQSSQAPRPRPRPAIPAGYVSDKFTQTALI